MSSTSLGRTKSAALPILLRPRAVLRFVFDGKAPILPKLFLLLSFAYLVFPVDAVPDIVPIVGWLDDLGVIAAAFAWFLSAVSRHEDARASGALDAVDEPPVAG